MTARAQVPESGRAQELLYSATEVDVSMEDRYIDRTVDLAAAGKLDQDRALLKRLRYISTELIRVAIELKPEAAQWQSEVHTTSAYPANAARLSMAKGMALLLSDQPWISTMRYTALRALVVLSNMTAMP